MMEPVYSPILTADAMRAADQFTIHDVGIPGRTLMESAGRGTAEALLNDMGTETTYAVYCGKGNNGGDGFVIARYLLEAGARVAVRYTAEPGDMSTDASTQFELLSDLATSPDGERLSLERFTEEEPVPDAAVHVDALLGTGLTSNLRDPILSLVRRINEAPGARIAVDIPTGLHADIGRPLGCAVRAEVTFTMGALKTGMCLNDGPDYSGRVEVIDIGIPRSAIDRAAAEHPSGCAYLSTDDAVRAWMPARGSDANKYSVGLTLIAAGSPGMSGAPVMAATAAGRIGAGYVSVGCDERIQDVLAGKLTEITTIPLPSSNDGIRVEDALEALAPRLSKADALLVGCGMGRGADTQAFIRSLLNRFDGPAVVDADGLAAFVDRVGELRDRAGGRWIVTPHMGEFRRLAGGAFDDAGIDADDRVALAQHFARAWNVVLVLKGLPSVTATPDGRAWINGTGSPALATAGSGDVLAGMCAGLLAQGLSAEQAAVAALHLGGAAADRYTEKRAERSMLATDLTDELPYVLKERLGL